MDLPKDLISKFVKITNDDQKKSTETVVYGTTVEHMGVIYVQLDGSEQLTPVETTADVSVGERVTVLIKDHTATITGNITSPSTNAGTVDRIVDEKTVDMGNQLTVYVDEKTQGLTVAIDQLITKTDATNEQVTTNTTRLDMEQGRIDTLVSEVSDQKIINNLIANSAVLIDLTGFSVLGDGTIRRYDSLEKKVEEEEDKIEDLPVIEPDPPSIPSEPVCEVCGKNPCECDADIPEVDTGGDTGGDTNDDKEKESEEIVIMPPIVTPKPIKTRIHFILTVECGDCILIETDSGKNILIDGPDSRLISSTTYKDSTTPIMKYLDKVGVTKLDYIICSHFHSDHAGALPSIMEKYCDRTSRFIYNNIIDRAINNITKEQGWKTVTYKTNAINKANSIGMICDSPVSGTVYAIDDNTSFTILKSSIEAGFNDYNDMSLVTIFNYKGIRTVLLGDISPKVQDELATSIGTCDIIKDAHHGYNASLSIILMDTARPKDVIVTRNHGFGGGYYEACNSVGMWQVYGKNIYTLAHTKDHIIIDFVSATYVINTSNRFYFQNRWMKFADNKNLWYYFKQGGYCAKNETVIIDGKRYHFDSFGVCRNPYSPE